MRKHISLLCNLYACAIVLMSSGRANALTPVSFSEGNWIEPQQRFTVRLSPKEATARGRFVFFIGKSDVTALMRPTAPGRYTYAADILPLDSGEQRMRLFTVSGDNRWQPLAEMVLNVLTPAGFEESEFTPRMQFTEKSQFRSEVSGDAFQPDPPTYHDGAFRTSLGSRQQRGGFEVRSSWNIVGTTVQEEALRFGEFQDDAPRVDLSDYLVELQTDRVRLGVGHVKYGNNPLLLSNLANRGIALSYRATDSLDLSVTSQSGQSITGYENLLGLENHAENSIQGFGVGYRLLNDGSAELHVEFTYLKAEITSAGNFNVGEVTDSEKSDGYGVVLRGQSSGGRIRGNLAFARSSYENPDDPFLSRGLDVVHSEETTDQARSASLDFDVLRPKPGEGGRASVSLSLRHDRTDALYKSVGAFLSPDVETNAIVLSGQMGEVSWQVQHSRARDNLANIDTILTTVTNTDTFGASVPLRYLADEPKPWLPQNLSYNFQRVHQYGDNLPPSFDPASEIPDQVVRIHGITSNWQFNQVGLAYTFNRSDQDNRQPARAKADFLTREHTLNVNVPFGQSVFAGLSLSRSAAHDREQGLTRFNTNGSLNVDWRAGDKFSLSGNYSLTRGDDSEDFSESDNVSAQTQLTYRFEIPGLGGRKLPGQAFLRHALSENRTVDNQFQFESDGRSWTINGGITISLF